METQSFPCFQVVRIRAIRVELISPDLQIATRFEIQKPFDEAGLAL